jgi:hypothetical protein
VSRRRTWAIGGGVTFFVLWVIGTFVSPEEDDEPVRADRTTTTTAALTTTSADEPERASTSTQPSTTTPSTTTTNKAVPLVVLTIDIDRNQVNFYAVASSIDADFVGETVQCSNKGKQLGNERYCWLYPTMEAFEAAEVHPENGEFEKACFVAYGGTGTSLERATRDDIMTPSSYLYDAEGCPPY